jgi:hypothetical protein
MNAAQISPCLALGLAGIAFVIGTLYATTLHAATLHAAARRIARASTSK